MDKNELERRLEAAEKQMIGLQDEIQNLKAKLADVQDEKEILDFPVFKKGEDFWFVNSFFRIVSSVSQGGKKDDYNFFHTEDYVKEFAKKCKLIAMMLHCKWYLCCDHHSDFNNFCILKYAVVFDFNEEKFVVEYSKMREWSTIYFDTIENAQKCADWLNEHWRENDD